MKRMIFTGILAIGAGATCLMAQAPPPAQATPPAAAAVAKAPAPKSKAELDAVQALIATANTPQPDPDKAIAAAEALLTKYADTEFKGVALYIEADAYQKKGDFARMEVFAERALEASPQYFQASLLLANHYAIHTRENDLDREEKLGKSEKYAHQVIDLMKTLPKLNPGISDDDWVAIRKDLAAEAYNNIGLANLTRKNYVAAAAAFQSAVDTNSHPEPAYMVRLASALHDGGKNDEAILWCDKVLAIPDVHPQVKNVAASIRAAAVKGGGKAPGGAPPPAK
jgi:tetratricopeptide (TPR) repeat protein